MLKVIIGLGNPGQQYEDTRHNAGFMAVDALAGRLGLTWSVNKKFKAETAESPGLLLIKPQGFMNNSGWAAAAVLSYYKLLPKKLGLFKAAGADLSGILTVIHDDLDIELGKYKISSDSGSAGHRGVESVIGRLKTKNFKRVRIGIRAPALEKIPADKFVLQKFSAEEKNIVNGLIVKIIEEIKKD